MSISVNIRLILFLAFLLPIFSPAQNKATPKAPASSKVQRQLARKKWKDERRIKRDGEKNIKEHHKRIQTKETRRKMRRDKAKSKQLHDNKKPFFLKSWFSKKR